MRSVYAIETPVGKMHAVEEDGRVVELLLPNAAPPATQGVPQTNLTRELAEYFAGSRKTFTVPLSYRCAAFMQKALEAALAIPYGQTVTYAALAALAGSPAASRAAGQAMARNPLPILIPCHRVLYSHGKKQNYGGGPEMKEFLLNLEKRNS